MRRVNAVRNARQEPYGVRPSASWDHDINGAIAEVALAKHQNIFWAGTVGRIDLPDVGPLQVRSKVEPDHRLVVLPTDHNDRVFVSVFVGLPKCGLCGWMLGGDAKRTEWLQPDPNKPDRYFVPNERLEPIDTLQATARASELWERAPA
jgi:hypothetical protein